MVRSSLLVFQALLLLLRPEGVDRPHRSVQLALEVRPRTRGHLPSRRLPRPPPQARLVCRQVDRRVGPKEDRMEGRKEDRTVGRWEDRMEGHLGDRVGRSVGRRGGRGTAGVPTGDQRVDRTEGLKEGPLGGPVGPDDGGGDSGSDGACSAGCSRAPMSPKASPSMLSSWDFSSSSRAFSAEVFPFATVAPISSTWRGLNSGCVPDEVLQPAWCRGYHAGLSFLRPGFNSRSGRHLILLVPTTTRDPNATTSCALVIGWDPSQDVHERNHIRHRKRKFSRFHRTRRS